MLSQRVFELATAEAPPLSDSTAEVGDTLAGSRDRRQSVQRDDEALALTAFEAANGGRVATPAEVQILRQLASQLDRIAAEDAELTTGWAWIGAAVYEAVDAGSAYVAPRRIREIATRWQREGRPGAAPSPIGDPLTAALPSTTLSMLTADRHGNDTDRSAGRDRRARRTGGAVDGAHFPDALTLSGRVDSLAAAADRGAARSSDGAPAVPARPGATSTGDADPGHDVPALWDAIVRELARSIDPDRLSGLTDAVTVTGLTPDEIELTAPSAIAAALGGEDGPLLTRALSAVLRRTVRLTIRPLPDVYPTPDEPSASESRPHHVPVGESFTGSLARGRSTHSATPSADAPETAQTASIGSHPLVTGDRTSATAATTPMPASAHRVGGIGLSDVHLWAAVVDEVVRAGDVTTANVTAWLKPARIAGRTPAGAHILAAPSDIARRRLDGPLRPALETALARVLGPAATLEVTTASRRDAT